jgi:hypothetical protein
MIIHQSVHPLKTSQKRTLYSIVKRCNAWTNLTSDCADDRTFGAQPDAQSLAWYEILHNCSSIRRALTVMQKKGSIVYTTVMPLSNSKHGVLL